MLKCTDTEKGSVPRGGRGLWGAVCCTWGREMLSRGWLRSALCFWLSGVAPSAPSWTLGCGPMGLAGWFTPESRRV